MGHYPHEGCCPFTIHPKNNPVRVDYRIRSHPKAFPSGGSQQEEPKEPPPQSPLVGGIYWGTGGPVLPPSQFIVERMGIFPYYVSGFEETILIDQIL